MLPTDMTALGPWRACGCPGGRFGHSTSGSFASTKYVSCIEKPGRPGRLSNTDSFAIRVFSPPPLELSDFGTCGWRTDIGPAGMIGERPETRVTLFDMGITQISPTDGIASGIGAGGTVISAVPNRKACEQILLIIRQVCRWLRREGSARVSKSIAR